jgi:hypothetical protein
MFNIYFERMFNMEMENNNKYASKGVAGSGLGLGIAGTALGLLNGNGLGNLLGGNNNCGCNEDHLVNRYEAGQAARIAELETEIKLRDSNIYTDQKILDVYKYFDGENKAIRTELAAQAVKNAQIEGTFAVLGEQQKALRNEFMCALNRERDERCCGDNSIVTYANATFYPKLVADVAVTATTTAQSTYNPLPQCGGCQCC